MTAEPVTTTARRARRARSVPGVGVALVAALTSVACGEQTAHSVAADAGGPTEAAETAQVVRLRPGEEKPRLTCPTGERSLMIADFAVGAKGSRTPEEAAGLEELHNGEQLVLAASGQRAWTLRADGTAREELHLVRVRGWLLHMRESCG